MWVIVNALAALAPLDVHLVCHTHDDVGWLKTVDQYYVGSKAEIQEARVQFILDSVIDALLQDPSRKFIYVEVAFFSRWWKQQTDQTKAIVRTLVNEGRLEFINGGWCMNDEAAPWYVDIIDQMTLGHQFLYKEFGVIPRIGWHIDPFGHSATQASLFASMGFDAFYFGRIDYQDKDKRMRDKTLEMIWEPSKSLGQNHSIFTGVLFNGYGPPPGFCFDVRCQDAPLQADKSLEDYDLDFRADDFARFVRKQAEATADNNIILTMGSDFNYEYAHEWFKNLDILIEYFSRPENKKRYQLNLFYSTPSQYLDAKMKSQIQLTTKTDDFFPYADAPNAYWTGYFTSRANFKGYVREMSAYLQSCRHVELLENIHLGHSKHSSSLMLEKAMGVSQHHDAVSGTAKQHVNDDYTLRLFRGQRACDAVFERTFGRLFSNHSFGTCKNLNESICDLTTDFQQNRLVVAYNNLAHSRSDLISLPVSSDDVMVIDSRGNFIPSQLSHSNDGYNLVFPLQLKPLSFESVFLVHDESRSISNITQGLPASNFISNEFIKIKFDHSTGKMVSLTNLHSKRSIQFSQEWQYYQSFVPKVGDFQASGAYIFRPMESQKLSFDDKIVSETVQGELVQEVRQKISSYISQVIRLKAGAPYLEIEYFVGPIDISDWVGKEVVSVFSSSLESGNVFYTDANGREVLKRVRDFRPTWPLEVHEPASGNYYPVNSRIFIREDCQDMQLTILNDRSQGGSSLKSGQLELMVHRRTIADDDRGVGEPLNEDIIVRGKFRVYFDQVEESNGIHRIQSELIANPIQLFFGSDNKTVNEIIEVSRVTRHGLAKQDLPANVHLVTLKYVSKYHALLRLAHLFATEEHPTLSKSVTIDLWKTFQCKIVREVSMTGLPLKKPSRPSHQSSTMVDLDPMEIRTFIVKFSHASTT